MALPHTLPLAYLPLASPLASAPLVPSSLSLAALLEL